MSVNIFTLQEMENPNASFLEQQIWDVRDGMIGALAQLLTLSIVFSPVGQLCLQDGQMLAAGTSGKSIGHGDLGQMAVLWARVPSMP